MKVWDGENPYWSRASHRTAARKLWARAVELFQQILGPGDEAR
jgi:hypothetical protein